MRESAADMIIAMLQSDPLKRPSVGKLFQYDFLNANFVPKSLPISCLTMAPRADQLEGVDFDVTNNKSIINRKPLLEINENLGKSKRFGWCNRFFRNYCFFFLLQ